MRISQETLRDAVSRGVLTEQEAEALWDHLEVEQLPAGTSSTGAPVEPLRPAIPLWQPVAAALLVAVVSSLALLSAFDRFGFAGLAVTAATLAGGLLAAGRHRHVKSGGRLGHVFITTAVLLVPVAVHGLVRAIGYTAPWVGSAFTDWLAGPWFPVQTATLAAAVLAIRAFRLPFLSAVVAGAVWFAAQDAAPILFGDDPAWAQRALLSSLTGLVILAAGLAVDRRTREDHAFWLDLCGLLAFSAGLTTMHSESDTSILLVAALHVGLVAASLLLERRSFAVAGALGLAAAAGHLADDLLDAKALSFALTTIALVVIGLGLLYHLHQERLERWAAALVPAPLRRLLPPGTRAGLRAGAVEG
jgi:hypothetical protein